MEQAKIPADRMMLATLSAFSCLVSELHNSGALDFGAFIENLQRTAAEHRAKGDPDNLGPALHRVSEYLLETTLDRNPPQPPRAPGSS